MSDSSRTPWASLAWWFAGFGLVALLLTDGDGFSALLAGLIGALFARQQQLSRTLRALRTAQSSPTVASDQTAAVPSDPASPLDPEQMPDKASLARPEQRQAASSATDWTSLPASPAAARPARPRTRAGMEDLIQRLQPFLLWLRGGNPLARVGIVVLFFGAAFLAKYSAEQGLFPVELRLALLALGALVLVALGWRIRMHRPGFARLLQGGGVAGFYLTVHAAAGLFGLLPSSLALLLMVLISVAAGVLAVMQNALALAFVGVVGGFLAPLLLATTDGSHVALFTWYAVLNLTVFIIALRRSWRSLNIAAFLFTFAAFGLFRATGYQAEDLLSTSLFLALFFLLFIAISIAFARRDGPSDNRALSTSLVFGLPIAVSMLLASLIGHLPFALAYAALGLGGFYAVLASVLCRQHRGRLPLLSQAFAALAVLFATLAIPLALDPQTAAALWALEGAGAVWLGVRQRRLAARIFGLILQLAGALFQKAQFAWLGTIVLVPADRNLAGMVLLALSGMASGYWLWRHRARVRRAEFLLAPVLALWGLLWWLVAGMSEIFSRGLWSGYWYGALLTFLGGSVILASLACRRWRWRMFEYLGWLLLALMWLLALPATALVHHPGADLGWLGWPVAAVAAWLLLRQFDRRRRPRWLLRLRPLWLCLMSCMFAVVLAWELSWWLYWELKLASGWYWLPWGLVPAALAGLSVRRPRWWPWQPHFRTVALFVAGPLAVWALFWLLFTNLHSPGSAAPLFYLPLLNPLDIGSALVLMLVFSHQRLLAGEGWLHATAQRVGHATLAALGFIWLTAALLRFMHHRLEVPWNRAAMLDSLMVQASLSIFWGALGMAIVLLATRRSSRLLWMSGAALLAVVVIKLFIFELAGSNTPARIVSFLSVGGLLLLGGWLAPLPPRRPVDAPPGESPATLTVESSLP